MIFSCPKLNVRPAQRFEFDKPALNQSPGANSRSQRWKQGGPLKNNTNISMAHYTDFEKKW
jgi:hypothetical protein